MRSKFLIYLELVFLNLLYAFVAISSKYTSSFDFFSSPFCLMLIVTIGLMGIYAIAWQQLLKYLPLSEAYMFKGLSIVFVMLLSYMIFGEIISINKIIGSIIIVSGIACFAKS